jgi:hypothetical protein
VNYRAKGKSFKDEAVWLSGMENLECGRRVISDGDEKDEGRGTRDEKDEGRGRSEGGRRRSEVGG